MDGSRVVKVKNPYAKTIIKQLHSYNAIYEHFVHNILFPDTRYDFVGISEDADGLRILLSQSYISDNFNASSQEDIDRYLIDGLKLKPENRYFYGNVYVAVTDVFCRE